MLRTMRVKRLQLTNYRGFASLDLDLDHPLTVLVGANGSGKSSILGAIALAHGSVLEAQAENAIVTDPEPQDLRAGEEYGRVEGFFRQDSVGYSGRLELSQTNEPPFRRSAQNITPQLSRSPTFLVLLETDRGLQTSEVKERPPSLTVRADSFRHSSVRWDAEDRCITLFWPGFERFVHWFKEREDVENERRVASSDLTIQDPQLRAVREAVGELMPGFSKLRIQRSPRPVMVVTKAGTQLRLDQLSDGERNLIAMTGELARRMAIAAPESESPREIEGVVLIDEIEQHLHPGLQREVLPRLRRAFPNIQFIVTTHSPQVLSTAPRDAIVAVDNFTARRLTQGAEGRDSNAILGEVFHVARRPERQLAQVEEVRRLIDDGKLDEARQQLDALATLVTEQDDDVMALRMRLFVADAGQEPPPREVDGAAQ